MPVPVQQVVAYIEAHLDQIEGVEDMASAFGVPLETLRKAFRREMGLPLGAYLTQRRVERAKQLLAETDLRAYEVGLEVGWKREDTAARVFRRETGETMQVYRQRARRHRR